MGKVAPVVVARQIVLLAVATAAERPQLRAYALQGRVPPQVYTRGRPRHQVFPRFPHFPVRARTGVSAIQILDIIQT